MVYAKKIVPVFCIVVFVIPLYSFSPVDSGELLKLNEPAPTFALRNLDGDLVFLRDYSGKLRQPWKNKIKHVVILSFFTTYCQPCLKEIPELEELNEKYREHDLKVFLINLKEKEALVHKYIKVQGFRSPVLLDKYGMIAKKYKVTSVPRIFIIDKEGKIAWMTKGYDKHLFENMDAVLHKLFVQ